MLRAKLEHFYSLVEQARDIHGDSAPKITDAVLEAAFPRTLVEAEEEGCEKFVRNGALEAIKRFIRKPPADERQRHFEDIDPELFPLVNRLASTHYFVPNGVHEGEHVGVAELCSDLGKLNAARKFMRQKGLECLGEADNLDLLYNHLSESRK